MRGVALDAILILSSGFLNAQVVVSRRDYAQRGRTFQQIWMGNANGTGFRQLTHSAREHERPSCSPDGKTIYFISDSDPERSRNSYVGVSGREVWAFDRQTGQERFLKKTGGGADTGPGQRSPDGSQIAHFAEGSLVITNAASGREIERLPLPKPDWPGQDIVWSPDGKRLLVGIYGENAGSGDPQSDYFLLNPAIRKLTPSLTARQLLWLQDNTVLYLRPYETTPLSPGSPHSVWTSQVAVYDLTSRKDTVLTSGLVLNEDFAACWR